MKVICFLLAQIKYLAMRHMGVASMSKLRGPAWAHLASFPGSCAGEEEREPGTHCSRMRQVPLVTCLLLRYTKITVNFCLPPERSHCMVTLPVGQIRAVLKSKTISL